MDKRPRGTYSAPLQLQDRNKLTRRRRSFSRDLSRLDAEGNPEGKGSGSSSEESSEEESSEEEDDPRSRIGQLPPVAGSDEEAEEEPIAGLTANLNSKLSTTPLTPEEEEEKAKALAAAVARRGNVKTADEVAQARKDRKAAGKKAPVKKAGGSGSESEDENDNKAVKKNMKLADLGAPKEMSRREREQADKAAAKERYAKMHAAGKTDEARADLGRLAEIRKQREAAAARRVAEAEAKEAASKAALEKSGKKAPGRK